jgi:flavin-dependent dehydrogenase
MQKRVIILGGGTAGWIVAARLAAEGLSVDGLPLAITLIESADIPTIGVGEGTWPSMRTTLERIGISEKEFLNACQATFKQGSRFVNWRSGNGESYDHPFTVPTGMGRFALGKAYSSQKPSLSFSHWSSLQSHIIDAGCVPKQLQTPEFAGVFNYGYHLDAGRFAELLKKHAVERLDVTHCIGHFSTAVFDDKGWLSGLLLDDGRCIGGDFFVDASGTHNKLIGGLLESRFVSLSDVSPNDRAFALPVTYADAASPIASATLSTAQDAGWIWDIGLQHRRGIGYVYSSAFTDDTRALDTLSNYVQKINPAADVGNARQLTINPGYRTQPWINNCVAIGMASGFIEPLEASALVMVELAAAYLCEHLPAPDYVLPAIANRYNALFAERWSRIRDFLQLHYRLSQRRDSAYWRTVTEEIALSDRLTDLLEEWKLRDPVLNDFGHHMELFPPASYLYVLLGMVPDYVRNSVQKKSDGLASLLVEVADAERKRAHYLKHLPDNRSYFKTIQY